MAGTSASIRNDDGVFRLLTAAPRPRELTGAVDLITHFGLREQYETFCKKSLPATIAESRYLRDVVGDTEVRKGEGMELCQLLQGNPLIDAFSSSDIQPFDIETLRRAFTLKESGTVLLAEADRGLPTLKSKDESKEKKHKRKHKKHKHRHKDKDKEKDKHKDKEKDKDKDKSREKDETKGENGEDRSKKHKKKKRRHEGDDDESKHKKKKHKSSPKIETGDTKIKK